MKKILVVLAALFGALPLNSYAQTFFVGGELGAAVWPDFTDAVAQSVISAGFSSVDVKQDRSSAVLGIYGGAWITENFGVEAAYTDLGEVKATITTVPASNQSLKYSANAWSVAGLGGVVLGKGTLYGKLGAYGADVKFDSAVRSVSTTSTGLLYGGGYSLPFGKHVIGKAELAVYNGVKFQTYNAPQGTNTTDNIVKVSVGVAYAF